MRRSIGWARALVNAVLSLAVVGIGLYAAREMATRQGIGIESFQVRAAFPKIEGLMPGDPVRIQGIPAGRVVAVEPPTSPGAPVVLVLKVKETLHHLVRVDSIARIYQDGVLGQKLIEIAPGTSESEPLVDGAAIATESGANLNDLVVEATATLVKVESVVERAEQGLDDVGVIVAGLREGRGSLGRLLRDDEVYNALVSLTDRGEVTLTALNDNLEALKRIWPLSRYFDERAYYEPSSLLYRPGMRQERRVLKESSLFEPNTAVLSADGKRRLDTMAGWSDRTMTDRTEVVVAAFTDESHASEQMAQRLTEGQARAVQAYLIETHKIDDLGWFQNRRKVAAIGFGSQIPTERGEAVTDDNLPRRRVELVLFTPPN